MDDHAPGSPVDPTVVEARRRSFGALAETYDAVRPPWPDPTVAWLLGSPAGPCRVLDLGAGTGLGSRTGAAVLDGLAPAENTQLLLGRRPRRPRGGAGRRTRPRSPVG